MFRLISNKKLHALQKKVTDKQLILTAQEYKINELEIKLKLETSKSNYWKLKSQNPNSDIFIVGTPTEIEYITDGNNNKLGE